MGLLKFDGIAEGNDLSETVEYLRGLIVCAGRDTGLCFAAVGPDTCIGEYDFVILLEAVLEA